MDKPILVLNFKTYMEGTGNGGLELAKIAERVAKETGKEVIVAVQVEDIRMISEAVSIPVFAEHVDTDTFGPHTGSVIPEGVKEAGAAGTLINHAEKEISDDIVRDTVQRCKELGLISIVCANTKEDAKRLSLFKPDYVAVEPPELIGGTISVSDAKPEVVKDTVDLVGRASGVPVLCGAGINSKNDVLKSLELGAKGVLLASSVVKSDNPYEKLIELLSGM